MGKRYTTTKYLSVLMITAGILVCTIMSAKAPQTSSQDEDVLWLAVGIFLLTFAPFLSARMGIYQEVIYGKYGKHPKEALFYTHALPLPGFLLLAPDILHHWGLLLSSQPVAIPVLNTECASLTVTLVVALRKFLSLLFSIMYFNNP